ncbi:XkdX family protein [Enterococcus dispar]|uniref:XkdX family protein n=1 Tax=Enterococcus dispar TaxID=44009 RepID=UPI0021D453F1|nr:XkdX family protein [Enterococcus dispar]MCU7356703.1 XkdX family protein [Enterococcus dispar]
MFPSKTDIQFFYDLGIYSLADLDFFKDLGYIDEQDYKEISGIDNELPEAPEVEVSEEVE